MEYEGIALDVRGAKWTGGTRSTYIPCGISLGATFDLRMIESLGRILVAVAKAKNAHVLLAPTMNMSRSPLGGRNFENYGEDPYLTGVIATGMVRGIQSQDVGACPKHYEGMNKNRDASTSMKRLMRERFAKCTCAPFRWFARLIRGLS